MSEYIQNYIKKSLILNKNQPKKLLITYWEVLSCNLHLSSAIYAPPLPTGL